MNSLLYAKLAKTNLSKNRQNILPYWLSCIGTVIMFYIMSTLSLSEGLKKMMGKATIQIVMQFGVYIIGLFAVIFLIYSNSFLAKRRKKEFGLIQRFCFLKVCICGSCRLEVGFCLESCVTSYCFWCC